MNQTPSFIENVRINIWQDAATKKYNEFLCPFFFQKMYILFTMISIAT